MTAVEWLEQEIFRRYKFTFQQLNCQPLEEAIEQAKEMENQQQGYSEEEVIAFGEFIFKHSLLTHTKGVKSLFEQFKKK